MQTLIVPQQTRRQIQLDRAAGVVHRRKVHDVEGDDNGDSIAGLGTDQKYGIVVLGGNEGVAGFFVRAIGTVGATVAATVESDTAAVVAVEGVDAGREAQAEGVDDVRTTGLVVVDNKLTCSYNRIDRNCFVSMNK